jgi:hypothetical protein
MSEGTPERGPAGGGNEGVDEDVASTGDEGRRAAGVSPPIADDTEPGTDAAPAPADDTGVPPDDELRERER